jgi:hypothetical protein
MQPRSRSLKLSRLKELKLKSECIRVIKKRLGMGPKYPTAITAEMFVNTEVSRKKFCNLVVCFLPGRQRKTGKRQQLTRKLRFNFI